MNTDKQILGLAIPSIVSNVTVPLLGLVDLTIVGHMGDASYIGAIAVGSMIFNVVYWVLGFLRMGTSGLTSQSLGRRDLVGVMRMFALSLALALAIAMVLVVGQQPLRWVALQVMHPSAEVGRLVAVYFNVCIWGAPAMLCLYSLTGWFIGMQNTRIPMLVAIFQNVVNIIASLSLVYGFGMKIEGVALGTLMAQWGGLFMALGLWWLHYGRLRRYWLWQPERAGQALRLFFRVNRDIFVRTLFLVSVNLFFTAAGARQGDLVLSANTLLLTLFTITSFVMDGFAYAGEALSGRYYGAQNKNMFARVRRRLFFWGLVTALAFTLCFALGGERLLSLLTNAQDVVAAAVPYLPWALAIPLVGMSAFVYDGIFIGITATRGMLVSSFIGTVCFFLVYFSLLSPLGNHALWLALLVYLGMRGCVQAVLMRRLF